MPIQNSLGTKPKTQIMIKKEKRPFSLIIVGGGPAGLTAGIYSGRSGIDTLLIEKAIPGGLITSTESIENYPGFPHGISGTDLAKKIEEQAKKYGLDMIFGKVTKIEVSGSMKVVFTEEHSYSTRSVIIATGSDPNKLGIPGEKEFTGKGVSYCAACDGTFYKDKSVAVIGGGNAALEEAIFLTKFAKLVTIIYRKDKLRADKVLQEKASANPNIFIKYHSVLDEIQGDNNVRSLKISDAMTGKRSSMNADGVFIYAGSRPNTEFINDLVKLDENGYVLTDDKLSTNIPGIFAAGDVRKKSLRQVVTSVADGAIAAYSAKEYLEQ